MLDSWTIDSWTILPSGVDWSMCCALETLNAHGTVTHAADTRYWLVGAPDLNQFTFAGFYFNNTGALGPIATSVNGGPFVVTRGETMAAFEVIDNTAPEKRQFHRRNS